MINTSDAYKKEIQKNRTLYHKVRILLTSGETIVAEDRSLLSFVLEDATSSDSKFDIGAAIINSFECRLDNSSGIYTFKDFTGAIIYPAVGLLLPDGTTEWIDKGIYYIQNTPKSDVTILLTGLDRMSFFEKTFDSKNIAYPTTVQTMVERCCQNCNVSFYGEVPNGNFLIPNAVDGSEITYLTIISECAKAAGCYARINTEGTLEMKWYESEAEVWIDGGYFDSDTPYQSGCDVDGGYFDDGQPSYLSGESVDGGSISWLSEFKHLYSLSACTIDTKQIIITGISVKVNDKEYISGESGYVLSLESKFATVETAQELADYLSDKIAGMTLYNASVNALSDPSIEAGDNIVFTDRKQVSYGTYLTRVRYSARNNEEYVCSAESISENNAVSYSQNTKTIQKAKEITKFKIGEYDQTVQAMTSLITQGFGLYFTKLEDGSGGPKVYMHDKATIEESTVIWTITSEGIMVSNDGTATWAVDTNGNALFNVITAHGLNADWLRVGGQGNGDGSIVVKDSDGHVLIILDNTGITMADGTSLINASGVCGDLTFTSGGLPYDIGWYYNYDRGVAEKQEVFLQAVIPDNYVITSALLTLSTCATYWKTVWDLSGETMVYNTCYGYPRKVKAYVGQGQVYKQADWDGGYGFASSGSFSQIVSGGFTSAGVDGSTIVNPKQTVSGNIKSLLKPGLNTIKFSPEDFTGSTNLSYAERTGTATALLSIKGYTKNS